MTDLQLLIDKIINNEDLTEAEDSIFNAALSEAYKQSEEVAMSETHAKIIEAVDRRLTEANDSNE
jgi:hypothetical protein